MLKIDIIGTGGMAQARIEVFRKMDSIRVTGVFSRSKEKARLLCEITGAKDFQTYENLLSVVDAVVICLPNAMHASFIEQALSTGRHALVEYPLCVRGDQMETLQNLAERTKTVLMVGNTIIHEAMFNFINTNRRRLGEIRSASSRVGWYHPDLVGQWHMDPQKFGNPFVYLLYPHIEYYRHFLGPVEWVIGRDESLPNNDKSCEYSFLGGTMMMAHRGGSTSTIQWFLTVEGSGLPRGMWLNGSKSSITIVSHQEGKSQVIWNGGEDGSTEVIEDQWGVEGSCRDFIEAVEGRIDHRPRLESDLTTLKIGFAAAESANQGKIIKIVHA